MLHQVRHVNDLILLGHTTPDGGCTRTTSRSWCTCDNGNPVDMLTFIRDFIGKDETVLFILERDVNRNVVLYRFDEDTMSVDASWLLIPEDADLTQTTIAMVDEELVQEDLSSVEQHIYGTGALNAADMRFNLAALVDMPLHVRQNAMGQWRVYIELEAREWILQRINVHTDKGLVPVVTEIHFDVEDTAGRSLQFYYAIS